MQKIFTFLLGLIISYDSCYAINPSADNDYYSNSYEERKVTFKIKPTTIFFTDKQHTNLPKPSSAAATVQASDIPPLLSYGAGVEAAATVFFSDYIASELSLGTYLYKVNEAAIKGIGYNYSNAPRYTDNKDAFGLPTAATLQLHAARFGGARPYFGGGIIGSLMYTKAKDYSIDHSWAGVVQAGVDFTFRDESLLGVEVKKYLSLAPAVHYQARMLGQEISGHIQMNSWIISVNFGLTF